MLALALLFAAAISVQAADYYDSELCGNIQPGLWVRKAT